MRWKEPKPPKSWQGILKADEFGPMAMQFPIYGDMGFRTHSMSEDCLYLNVWIPAKSGDEKLPVLVYFYGGGYRASDGSESRYDGESMARKGIVSLTVNYRLGIFGFFARHELTKESAYKGSGSYVLMDQTLALKWVQQNITSFGGDPNQVTIIGESCGARSVCAQMTSPLAKSLAELRTIPADKLLKITGQPETPYSVPNADNYFLPELPIELFKAGKQAMAVIYTAIFIHVPDQL